MDTKKGVLLFTIVVFSFTLFSQISQAALYHIETWEGTFEAGKETHHIETWEGTFEATDTFVNTSRYHIETWEGTFKAREGGEPVNTTVEIITPIDGEEYDVLDFPILIEVSIDEIKYTDVCTIYGENTPNQEYCEVDASWNKGWLGEHITDFFVDYNEIDCIADSSYSDLNISEGDVLSGGFCDAKWAKSPFNQLLVFVKPKDVSEGIWLDDEKRNVEPGDHTFEFTIDEFKETWDEEEGFRWGWWEIQATYNELVDGAVYQSDKKEIYIKEPPIPESIQDTIAKQDKTFRDAWYDFESPLSQQAKFFVGFLLMIIFAIIGGYYGGSMSGFGAALLIGVMFDLLGWMPDLFSIFLIVGVSAFVVRLVWKVISPFPR